MRPDCPVIKGKMEVNSFSEWIGATSASEIFFLHSDSSFYLVHTWKWDDPY